MYDSENSRGYAEGNSLQVARAIKLLMDIKLYVSEISSSFSLKCTHPVLSRLSQCHTGWVKVIRVNQGVCVVQQNSGFSVPEKEMNLTMSQLPR